MLRPRRKSSRTADRRTSLAASRRLRPLLAPEPLESRRLLSVFTVINTLDNGDNVNPIAGSLRAAIIASNQSARGPNSIVFDIPASTAPNVNSPVAGFDPNTQTWTIMPSGPLPTVTTPVDIDGFTQGNIGIPYRYADQATSATQSLDVLGATSGTFTLSTSAPLAVGTTPAIPYNPTPAQVQAALEAVLGVGNVSVAGAFGQNQQPGQAMYITFEGAYAEQSIPNLTPDATNLVGTSPSVDIETTTVGGQLGDPILITSTPNTIPAIDGNNARIRVIIDGSQSNGGTGFVLDTSHSTLRGLIVANFVVGVSIPNPSDIGDSIQGCFIGDYLVYPVDSQSGLPLAAPAGEVVVAGGNAQQGVIINGPNSTLGGASDQDDVVIGGNGAQGVWLQAGALGTQVLGCQIGVIGPSDFGVYWAVGNGAQGVLVQSSSDLIGVAHAGNLIAASAGDGVEIDAGATRVQVAGNYIGVAPGGGFKFGNPPPGNGGHGVEIIGATNNTIGGTSTEAGNTISYNAGDGVVISGVAASGNIISNNVIGLTADGSQALGNGGDGVVLTSPGNQVGPGNVISANQVGVRISGASAAGITVVDNLIGTDLTGKFDLGNAFQGVLVDGASGVTIQGNAQGSQVISGNHVGIQLTNSASGALIEGTFIGSDQSGTIALPNARQGILIDQGAWDNTIGGITSTPTNRNLISANHWGIEIDGGPPGVPAANWILGNLIGTDITGLLPLGNETEGVMIVASSGNTIGGLSAAQGNTIAFNTLAGVQVVSGNADTIESNSIFSNGGLGIELDGTSNDNITAPTVTDALPDAALSLTEIFLSYTMVLPNSIYLVQFFSTPGAVAQSDVEGKVYLGSTSVRVDSNGAIIGSQSNRLVIDVPVVVAANDWVTATATVISTPSGSALSAGDTSEFSAPPRRAINPFLVTSVADTTAVGTLRAAIQFSNDHPSPNPAFPNNVRFQIPGVGLQTIYLQQALEPITAALIIDGYSQPGASVNDSRQLLAPDTIDDQETDIATILVQVDGSQILAGAAFGLDVRAPGCTIDGLILTGFGGAAIFLEPSSSQAAGTIGDTVWGNFIGVTQFSPRTFNLIPDASRNTNANGVGILIDGPNNMVGGTVPWDRNVIQGNHNGGVIIYGDQGTGNAISSNFILDNGGDGVLVLSPGNHIGQASGFQLAGAGNLISGNAGNGVHILDPAARGNTVANNEIGTQVGLAGLSVPILGTQPRPNGLSGVLIENAPSNTVGGLVANSANVIAGNGLHGITIENYANGTIPAIVSSPPTPTPYTSATRNIIEGNLIGFNDRNGGVETIANKYDGINISASGSFVGGTSPAARNTIAANGRNGIAVTGIVLDASDNPDPAGLIPFPQPVANVIQGNFIGTVSGSDDYGNAFDGILLDQAGGNTVGGTASGAGNVVSNNNTGIAIAGSLSAANVVAGNRIGTSWDGTAPMGNTTDGIAIVDASANIIGGTAAGSANIIAGNTNGIHLSGSGAIVNLIEGNFIGTNTNGANQLGNSLDGVRVDGNASSNTIGGTAAGAGNVIAQNGGAGVDLRSGVGNTILSNSISSNDATGIVLAGFANDGQTAPTITAATPLTTATLVSGTLASTPGTTFLIQIFSSTKADVQGSYEGQALVGSTTITTDSSGQAEFGLALPESIPFGAAITATATSLATGDTSEFSGAALNAPLIEFSTTQYYVSQPANSAVITITRNTDVGSSTVVYSAGPGTAVPNVDFKAVTAAVSFAPGQTSATFSVPILATQGRVGDYTVKLALSHPTGAGLGAPATAVLTITSSPGTLQFTTSAVNVPESVGSVVITVNRARGAAGTVTVNYAAVSVDAVPGVDYLPVSGTLTFQPGVTQESFTLPVLGNSPNPNDATIAVSLSNPTGGAALGSPTTELVTIDKPLILTGQQLSAGRRGITSVTLSFNKPLDPAQAGNLANFGFFVYWANSRGVFIDGGKTTPLASATYNSTNRSVTLTPSAVLPLKRLYRINVDGSARAVLGNGLTDTSGGVLAGSSGVPGTPYLVTFGAGKRLTYLDSQRNTVTLQLRRGGIISFFQALSGAVQQVGLIGAVPGRSTLSGSVKRGPGGTGRTSLPPITGAGGVRIQLKARPFVVSGAEAVAGEGMPFARRAWHP